MIAWDRLKIQRMPWYAALRPSVERTEWPSEWPTLADYQHQLDGLQQPILTASGKSLRVVMQNADQCLDWREAYEPRIYRRGELQTRLENWHDCFNLLTWISFPASKAVLNARQYALLAARAEVAEIGARSPRQDALTQFDESGVIVLSADPILSNLLTGFQWKSLFWENRGAVNQKMRYFLFGHGLMERALTPYRGLTGKGIILPVSERFFAETLATQLAQTDYLLAQYLENREHLMQPQDLVPVPLLGIPGFSSENTQAEYYDDPRYFRPGRRFKG